MYIKRQNKLTLIKLHYSDSLKYKFVTPRELWQLFKQSLGYRQFMLGLLSPHYSYRTFLSLELDGAYLSRFDKRRFVKFITSKREKLQERYKDALEAEQLFNPASPSVPHHPELEVIDLLQSKSKTKSLHYQFKGSTDYISSLDSIEKISLFSNTPVLVFKYDHCSSATVPLQTINHSNRVNMYSCNFTLAPNVRILIHSKTKINMYVKYFIKEKNHVKK